MIYNYDVKDRDDTCLSKSNLGNRGKIAYHKVKAKTLLDFVKNKESEGCTSIPLASAQTLYPRLTTFMDIMFEQMLKVTMCRLHFLCF